MSGASPQEVQREHGVLLRQWACAQERVSEQMCAQQRRCAALEAELMRWRARAGGGDRPMLRRVG